MLCDAMIYWVPVCYLQLDPATFDAGEELVRPFAICLHRDYECRDHIHTRWEVEDMRPPSPGP